MKASATLLTMSLLLLASHSALGQSTNRLSDKPYQAWVYQLDSRKALRGQLIHHNDSLFMVQDGLRYVDLESVKYVKFRRQGRVGRGALYGGITGFATGILLGAMVAASDDGFFSGPEIILSGGLTLAIPGTLIGTLVGAGKIKIPINGISDKEAQLNKYILEN